MVADAMSSTAMALASCSITRAVLPSGATAMYSGSTSCATLAAVGKMRTPRFTSSARRSLNAVKDAVATVAEATPAEMSMTLTEPSGSVAPGSPSFATSTFLPSGVKVSMSGSAPTVTLLRIVPSDDRNTTWPGSCTGLAGTAAAMMPPLTATLVASMATVLTSVGVTGFEMSKIWSCGPVT